MRGAIAAICLAVAGCASPGLIEQGAAAYDSGDRATGVRLFEQAAARGDARGWFGLGYHHENIGEMQQAVGYYTLAARWGLPLAQQALVRLGQPVPSPDLASERAQRAANAAAAVRLLNPPRPTVIQPRVNCQSYRVGDSVHTSCN